MHRNIILRKMLVSDEGWSNKSYTCSEGFETIGVGHKVLADDPDGPWTDEQVEAALLKDIEKAILGCLSAAKENDVDVVLLIDKCSLIRLSVLVAMVFQMGPTGVSKFKKMWAAIKDMDYNEASVQMLDSKWAKQTPARAKRMAKIMRTNTIPKYYEVKG